MLRKKNEVEDEMLYPHEDMEDGETRIWEIVHVLVKKRVLILLYTVFVSILIVCLGSFLYLKSPTTKISVLNFSLMFDGINNGEYPNGMKFVESDIISSSVLQQVYDNNNLKQYFGNLDAFKKTVSIQRYNPGLAFLNFEYKSKLEEKKLTSAERYEIEQDFYRQTANMIAKPVFTLVLSYPDAVKYDLPDVIAAEILNKTLNVWLTDAKRYQGITKYNISLISNRVDKEFIKETDYFNSVDLMRLLLNDLNSDITKLEEVPNSKYLRLKHGDKTYSIQDLKLRVDFIKKYILEPLLATIRVSGANKNLQDVTPYIDAQINSLEIKSDILMREKDNYENMLLERYTTTLEPILEINSKEVAVKNEISFYNKFFKTMKTFKSSGKTVSSDTIKRIISYQTKLIAAENDLINLIEKFYNEICNHNLESNAAFYKVNSYSSFINHKLSFKFVVKISLISWVLLELLLIVILVVAYFLSKENKRDGGLYPQRGYSQRKEYNNLRTLPERSESLENRREIPK